MQQSMLTTIDNPHDPFKDYAAWYAWDTMHGHHTANLLARIAFVSSEMSEADQEFAVEVAIDEIVREDVLGKYKKVSRQV